MAEYFGSGGAGEAGVDEDPLARDSERKELVGSGLDVLCVGGAAAVSDAERLTRRKVFQIAGVDRDGSTNTSTEHS